MKPRKKFGGELIPKIDSSEPEKIAPASQRLANA